MNNIYNNNASSLGVLCLRLGIGCAFTFVYGLMKVQAGPMMWEQIGGALGNFGITFAPTFWGFMATLSEFGGGILLILGLFVRPAAAFMAFTMIIALSTHFANHDPWYIVFNPINMLAVFLAIIFLGAGKYSLNYLIFGRKKINKNNDVSV